MKPHREGTPTGHVQGDAEDIYSARFEVSDDELNRLIGAFEEAQQGIEAAPGA